MDQDGLKPTQPPSGADLTGMRVEGFIDGAFDTGYFMTVRVNGQTLRGMLYREDACIAPSVNTPTRRRRLWTIPRTPRDRSVPTIGECTPPRSISIVLYPLEFARIVVTFLPF